MDDQSNISDYSGQTSDAIEIVPVKLQPKVTTAGGGGRQIRRKRRTNNNNIITATSSVASWSHISTPDSLEWDIDDQDQNFKSEDDSLDLETKDLLQEIELLKNRVLSETGISLNGDSDIVES